MAEVEVGRGKRGRQGYAFDDIGIVPSRRTRDPEEVSTTWQIDAYRFDTPILAAPVDSVVSPATAITIGRLGGLPVLDLEGLWTRYEDPEPLLAEIAELGEAEATVRMQQIYSAPIRDDLVSARLAEIRAAGVTVAGALSPPRVLGLHAAVLAAGVDILVIRGTTVSAEHVSSTSSTCPSSSGGARRTRRHCTSCAPAPRGCWSGSAGAPAGRPARCSGCRWRWPAPSPTWQPPDATTWTNRADGTSTSLRTGPSAGPVTSPRP
jgi:hypothetical protein